MSTPSLLPRSAFVAALLLSVACGRGAEHFPPVPAAMDALDPAVVEGIEDALAAVRAAPEDASAWVTLGMVYQANQLFGPALDAYAGAQRLEPEDAHSAYHHGLCALQLGEEELALEDLLRAMELAPGSPVPTWRLGLVRLERGELGPARELFERSTRVKATFVPAWLGLVRVHLLRDENQAAMELLTRVLADVPRNRYANELMRTARRQAGLPEDEDFRFRSSTFEPQAFDPWEDEVLKHRAESRVARAIRLLTRDRAERAVPLLEAELADGRRDITVLGNLAEAYEALGRRDAARRALEDALELAPENVRFNVALAELQVAEGRPDEALATLERALAFAPARAELWRFQGRLLLEEGRPEEAVAALREGLRLDGRNPRWWVRLGNAELALGRPEDAARAFEEAVAFTPPLFDALAGLATARAEHGEHEAAARALADAARHPLADETRMAELRERLARLRTGGDG